MVMQVDVSHYNFRDYTTSARWASYFRQVSLAMEAKPRRVLEVGAAGKVFGDIIRRAGVEYVSLDFDHRVTPDVVASVTSLPLEARSFDLVCAFQVLEHIPYDFLGRALEEIARVTAKTAIISLPDSRPYVGLALKVPKLRQIRFVRHLPYSREHVFDGEHYWEIGKSGFPVSRLRADLKRHFGMLREHCFVENPYHRFFVLSEPGGR